MTQKPSDKVSEPQITAFGVKMFRPTYASGLRAALIGTLIFFVFTLILPPSSGSVAASQWCAIFLVCWLSDRGVKATDSLRAFALVGGTAIFGNLVGFVVFGLFSSMFAAA
ncbi:hypothetical protein ACOTHJ_12680 [Achromobacter xylosoxidans]|uniref:hypothetical protein n=1 Tax=Achromobacter anxifer TaxID=1287737 RepID=UPI00155C4754|nr:hypothetical protein [Achromobacter anxifer]CAB5514553.1 hypothetical protein LMG26857_03612 [Achromobacter anxifer]